MHNLNKLTVYQTARANLRDIITASKHISEFGDLKNQIQRSAISVVSNIAEGAGSNSNANFARFLGYAKASNKELLAQIEILEDLGQLNNRDLQRNIDWVSAMLFKLIQSLHRG